MKLITLAALAFFSLPALAEFQCTVQNAIAMRDGQRIITSATNIAATNNFSFNKKNVLLEVFPSTSVEGEKHMMDFDMDCRLSSCVFRIEVKSVNAFGNTITNQLINLDEKQKPLKATIRAGESKVFLMPHNHEVTVYCKE